jgi:hypothetical protein
MAFMRTIDDDWLAYRPINPASSSSLLDGSSTNARANPNDELLNEQTTHRQPTRD